MDMLPRAEQLRLVRLEMIRRAMTALYNAQYACEEHTEDGRHDERGLKSSLDQAKRFVDALLGGISEQEWSEPR